MSVGTKDNWRDDKVVDASDQAEGRRRGRRGGCLVWEDKRGFRQLLEPQVQSDRVISAILRKEGM